MVNWDIEVQELLKSYRNMLEFIRNDNSGKPEREAIVSKATATLKRAEKELIGANRSSTHKFFGKMDWKYDFLLYVESIRETDSCFFLGCHDRQGRSINVEVRKEIADFTFEEGMSILFRGQVRDNLVLKGRCITVVEVLSGLQQV